MRRGALFISDNGWHPHGAAPYADDNFDNNGERWAYAYDLYDQKINVTIPPNMKKRRACPPLLGLSGLPLQLGRTDWRSLRCWDSSSLMRGGIELM